MGTETNLFIIYAIVFTGILIFFVNKKRKKLKALSEKELQKEMDKHNERSQIASLIKGILEIFDK